MLKLVGLVVLIVLILVGALLPLKYTARMHLPKRPSDRQSPQVRGRNGAGPDPQP
jgi:hypothetical protein